MILPEKEHEILYRDSVKEAKAVFGRYFTSKLEVAPHGEEFEVAVIPVNGERFDNAQVCLLQFPALFMTVNLRQGKVKTLSIKTRSGGIRELWSMVKPVINMVAAGDIGFRSYSTENAEAEGRSKK